ncbi:MAG: beta-eliminating lyase-related protein [Christensenellales bacterium]
MTTARGAHPIVMQRLLETNMEHTCGYGLDDYSLRAADVIREKCGQPGAAVHIMVGGTSANSIAIAAFLRPYEAAICAPTGAPSTCTKPARLRRRAQGAPCAAKDGKVTPEGVEAVCALHTDEHMVAPRLLFTSASRTEIGTVYHLDELKALREVCDRLGLDPLRGRRESWAAR